ncbi:MAG: molybdopterin-dependent oxidoreductase [Gammaproteobacteria bacterium]|nr:molybdopterin-dependent oxidoreductase [Gammaproteobacteria bacterium]
MNHLPFKLDRRQFLGSSVATAGGLFLGTVWHSELSAQFGRPAPAVVPDAFIHIGADDIVTLIIHKPEVGQGTETSIAMLLAEELDCDWDKVRTVFAPVDAVYGAPFQGTVGSMAIRTSWMPMRMTGAAGREMLIQAAATQWGIDPYRCRTGNSLVTDIETNESLSYGSLAEAASTLEVPDNPRLKEASEFNLLGTPVKRRDTAVKINGQAQYGIDISLPGMVYAVLARCPVPGGTLLSFDVSATKAVPGVLDVIEVPQGVAVIADNTWAAISGRRVLQVLWDEGENATLNSTDISAHLHELVSQPGVVALDKGDADTAREATVKTVEARYEVPYLAHAPMEPLNSVARVNAETCDVWTGTQMPGIAHLSAVQACGLPADQVNIHSQYVGGGFGSRGGGPLVAESVEIAKQLGGVPVKLLWTREDDLQHDRFRPVSCVQFNAGVDASGIPVSWKGTVACSSFMGLRDGIDRESISGLAELAYDFPYVHFQYHEPGITVPTNYWRSVGLSQNTFFAESFIDELAVQAGMDSVDYRRTLLADNPRLLAVLNLAAEKVGWNGPPPNGRFRGVAVMNGFGSFNAQIVEISLEAEQVHVHRVVSAIDCGSVINPAGVVQQVQSAIVYGLSAALRGEITFEQGRVQQTNLHQYEPLRLKEMPVVEVHIVASDAAPGGVGELGTPAIAPAVTNAIFSATGKRLRRLPIDLA